MIKKLKEEECKGRKQRFRENGCEKQILEGQRRFKDVKGKEKKGGGSKEF